MPVSDPVFYAQTDRLLGHFKPGQPKDRFGEWLGEFERRFKDSERMTDAIFEDSTDECIDHFSELPHVKEFSQVFEAVRVDHVRDVEFPALPKPEDIPLTPQGERNMAHIRQLVRAHAEKGRLLTDLHRSLVQNARNSGLKMRPPLDCLTDQGAAWVRDRYQAARDYCREHGSLAGYESGPPPESEALDVLGGIPLKEVAPRWTESQENDLVAQWPHLANDSTTPAWPGAAEKARHLRSVK